MASSSISSSSSQPNRGLSFRPVNQEQRSSGLSLPSSSSQSSGSLSLYPAGRGSAQGGFALSLRGDQGHFSLSGGAQLQGDILIARELEEGALSLEKDQASLKMVNDIAMASIQQIVEMRQSIDTAIKKYIEQTYKFLDEYTELSLKLAKDVVAGRHTEQAQADNAMYLHNLAEQVSHRYYEAAKQLMELSNLNNEGKLNDYKGVVELVFLARFKEIELFSKRLELLREHDDHKLKIMTALHNQELKAEAQLFDQYMKKAKFDSSEEQRKFENSLADREQKRKEEKDLQEMALAEIKMDKEFRLETLKAENRKEVEIHATESNAKVERARISSQERVAYAQAAASRSGCIIS